MNSVYHDPGAELLLHTLIVPNTRIMTLETFQSPHAIYRVLQEREIHIEKGS